MKTFLVALLTVGSLSAQASMLEINGPLDAKLDKAERAHDQTHFETLGDLFQAGTLPNLAKISNIAWSGRCFLADEPNEPTNAGYVFRQKRDIAVGPIGERVKRYEAASYWRLNEDPNFYDSMSLEDVLLNNKFNFINAKITSSAVEILSKDLISQLRKSGPYLIENLLHDSSSVGPIVQPEVYGRCYYFIPDLNE